MTKRGVPAARVVPLTGGARSEFGLMRGMVLAQDDIVRRRASRLGTARSDLLCAFQIVTCLFQVGIFENSIHHFHRMMRKSIHTKDYAAFLKLLIEARRKAGLTQAQLGSRLPFGQPGISKIERGERRVDVVELRMICRELGIGFEDFAKNLEARLAGQHYE